MIQNDFEFLIEQSGYFVEKVIATKYAGAHNVRLSLSIHDEYADSLSSEIVSFSTVAEAREFMQKFSAWLDEVDA